MAAVASVTFTSAGTATLGAAAFTLAGFQAAGEEAGTTTTASEQQNLSGDYEIAEESANIELTKAAGPTAEEKEAEDKLNEQLEDNARMVKEKEEAEKNECTSVPLDKEALERALDNVNRSSGSGSGYMAAVLAGDPVETETVSPQAAPAQQGTTVATGTLPSNDLGFTSNPYASTTSGNEEPVFQMTAASPATGEPQAVPDDLLQTDGSGTTYTPKAALASVNPYGYDPYGLYGSYYGAPAMKASTAAPGNEEPARNLLWLDPTGTWGAQDYWYEEDRTTRATFADGDNATIEVPNFDIVEIRMNASASAGNMTVKNGEGVGSTHVTLTDANDEYSLGVQNLVLEEQTSLQAATKLEASGTIQMGHSTSLELLSGQDATIAANISSTDKQATIRKHNQASTVTLSGDNKDFSGPIIVIGGKLVAESATALGTGTIDVGEGAELSLAARGAMQAGTLTLSDGATVSFVGDTSLTLSGKLYLGEDMTWDLSRLGFGNTGSITLITADGGVYGNFTGTTIIKPTNITSASLSAESGSVVLTFTMAEQRDLYWQGGVGDWSSDATVQTWHPSKETADRTSFIDHDNVIFDDRAAVSSVTIRQDEIKAGKVTVENGTRVSLRDGTGHSTLVADSIDISGSLTTLVNVEAGTVNIAETGTWGVSGNADREFSGKITGEGALTKSGTGDLSLSGDNSAFSGSINLNAGTITAGSGNALGTGTNILLGNNTILAGSVDAVNINGNTTIRSLQGTAAEVAANLAIQNGARLLFDTDGSLHVTGSVSNTGTIVKDGTGVLSIGAAGTGDVEVLRGVYDMTEAWQSGRNLHLGGNSALLLSGADALALTGKLTLDSGSALDISKVEFGESKKVTLATVTELEAVLSTKGLLEAVLLRGAAEEVNSGTRYVRLETEKVSGGTKLVATVHDDDHNGCYWRGVTTATEGYTVGSGQWIFSPQGDTREPLYWTDANGTPKLFIARNATAENARSAYFFELEGVDKAVVDIMPYNEGSQVRSAIRDMIVDGGTEYEFNSDPTHTAYLNFSATADSVFLVREGAVATVNVGTRMADQSLLRVENGATLTFHAEVDDTTSQHFWDSLDFYNVENNGTLYASGNVVEVNNLTNANKMDIVGTNSMYSTTFGFQSGVNLRTLVNTTSGQMSIRSNGVIGSNGLAGSILNEGELTFGTLGAEGAYEGVQNVVVEVSGQGEVKTDGARVLFTHHLSSDATGKVTADRLELGAEQTVFNFETRIADSTTVDGGKEGYFYGTSTLGTVDLAAGDTKMVLGPHGTWGMGSSWMQEVTGYENAEYTLESVTAGAGATLEVNNGAQVTADSFNTGSTANVGNITVGSDREGAEQAELADATLTIAGDATLDVFTVYNGTATVGGHASINKIMQDGGELRLNADSVLHGVDDGQHGDAPTGGTVTGGTLTLADGITLDQNAVIDVRNGGTYTVNGTGSCIDASDLKLIVDRTKTSYITVSGDDSQNASGFMSAGDEFVKLFDMEAGTSLTSNNEAIYHSAASDMMVLIGTDNYSQIQSQYPGISYDLEDYIGYGYLHTSEKVLKTYYVRDPREAANAATLGEIIDASTVGGEVKLENVVFDVTEHNEGSATYNGSLTVDRDTKVDLFSVTEDARAAININQGATVTADGSSPGVSGTLELLGEGVYEIQNRNDLGTNIGLGDGTIMLGSDWDGTVRVTGTSTSLALDSLSVGQGANASTIEFNHWTGALESGTHTVDGKVNLVGTGTVGDSAAMTLKTGEEAVDYTFTNAVTGGDALINHTEGGNVSMTFTGDTSGWTGTYNKSSEGTDTLTFTGGDKVNADVAAGTGTMNVTYGGDVVQVNGDVIAYSAESTTTMNVAYSGKGKVVKGNITSDGATDLNLIVGDGEKSTDVFFTGTFTDTQSATLTVKEGSKAVLNTDAELLRVVGETGSTLTVGNGNTLSLASTDPETGYSEIHNLVNAGTIEMKAAGGDLKLVDDQGGNAYNLGDFALTGEAGTAAIETSGVQGQATNVNITSLSGPRSSSQVLKLTNDNGQGTVNYNIGSPDSTEPGFSGTLAYGGAGETNMVIKDGVSTANAVLETSFASYGDAASANIMVDTATAKVLGLNSDINSAGKSMVVRGSEGQENKVLNITGDDEYLYFGQLGENLDVAYTGKGMQTIIGGTTEGFNGAVTVDNGSPEGGILNLLSEASVNITDLTIGANDTLAIGDEGTAAVSGTLVAKGNSTDGFSNLQGNLTLGSTSTYDVSASGGKGGLNLTGALTITQGALLSSDDMNFVWAMEKDAMYDLAFSVTDMSGFGEDVNWDEGVDASKFFDNGMKEGEFYIRYSGDATGGNGGNVGTVYLFRVAVPEPATSTLSLLALCALAARRRRRR